MATGAVSLADVEGLPGSEAVAVLTKVGAAAVSTITVRVMLEDAPATSGPGWVHVA